jgi:hypothetical protein
MPKLLFARPPLDAVEERKIRKLAGARHAPADWIHRAQMIALSWDGLRVPGIGQAQRSQLIALVASPPPGRLIRDSTGELGATDLAGPAVWTLDALTAAARATGIDIARSQVRRILLADGVRWRRPRSWASSADPEFGPKEHGLWASTRTRRRTPQLARRSRAD